MVLSTDGRGLIAYKVEAEDIRLPKSQIFAWRTVTPWFLQISLFSRIGGKVTPED